MTLNLSLPVAQHTDFSPRITVIGVGGGGTNAVNNMIAAGLDGVEFVVANTDAQSLLNSKAERRVQLGPHLTQGLGAGAKPEIGRAAAEEATEEVARHIDGSHMVFITAGMGGGTGTGAAPVIARMARERGVLTVGVVTKPFDFEGPKRKRAADQGIEELQQFVDTLIVIPNQNLFALANERTTFAEAFKMADQVLYMGVRGVTDLMVNPGLVNLDFADIRTVMAEMGKAMMGTGESEGDDRAVTAAEKAISNPLLEDTSMRGAKGVLINITGGYDMTLYEVDAATNRIRKEVDEEANIIFGSSIDETMNGRIRVSVVATGIDVVEAQAAKPAHQEQLKVVVGGRGLQQPHGNGQSGNGLHGNGQPQRAPGMPPVMAPPAQPARRPMQPASTGMGGPMLRQQVRPDLNAPHQPQSAAPQGGGQHGNQAHAYAQPPAQHYDDHDQQAPLDRGPVVLGPAPITTNDPSRRMGMQPVRPMGQSPQPAAPPARPGGLRGLFQQVTGSSGSGLMRRNVEVEAPPPARVEQPATLVIHPSDARRTSSHQAEMGGIDIPTFLRQQKNLP
jgi:cell division protein FtsZ